MILKVPTYKAVSRVEHGVGEGEVEVYGPQAGPDDGDRYKGDTIELTEEEAQPLLNAGAIVTDEDAAALNEAQEERERLQAELDEARAQIAALQSGSGSTKRSKAKAATGGESDNPDLSSAAGGQDKDVATTGKAAKANTAKDEE